MLKLNTNIYNAICIIIFISIFCTFPDIDYLTLANKYHINNTIFGIIIVCLASLGIYLLKINKTIAVLVFILFFMIMRTRFNYIELFVNPREAFGTEFSVDSQVPDPTATLPLLVAQDLATAQDFLVKQIQADPNKTKMEKHVIDGIINHYFVKSDKLEQLSNFNVSAQVANPIPGDQKLT